MPTSKLSSYFSLCFLIFFFQVSFAQEEKTKVNLEKIRDQFIVKKDTSKIFSKFLHFTNLDLIQRKRQTVRIDTSLNNILYYDKLSKPERPFAFTGNYGSPHTPLLFEKDNSLGFYLENIKSSKQFSIQDKDIKFYKVPTPITQVNYVNGATEEQHLNFTFSKNAGKNFNFTVHYGRYQGKGVYANRDYDLINFYLSLWFSTKNNRYNGYVAVITNFFQYLENGSIKDQNFFFDDGNQFAKLSRGGLETWLSNAQRKTKVNGILLHQTYYLGKIDSVKIDKFNADIIPSSQIVHTIKYKEYTTSFYTNQAHNNSNPILPEPTGEMPLNIGFDVFALENYLGYTFNLKKGKNKTEKFTIDIGARLNQFKIFQNSDIKGIKNLDEIAGESNIRFAFSQNSHFSAGAKYLLSSSFQEGDFLFESGLDIKLSKKLNINISAYYSSLSPSYQKYRTFNNYYNWDFKNASKEQTTHIKTDIFFADLKLKISGSAYLINNMFYWGFENDRLSPLQNRGWNSIYSFGLEKEFKAGIFNSRHIIRYQYNDNEKIIRTPNLYTMHSFYFITNSPINLLFKYATNQYLKFGFDIKFHTSFQNYSYNPVLSVFYADNGKRYDTYPTVDAYVVIGFQKANFMLRYTHVDQGWFAKYDFTVHRYAMPDGKFKFGIYWLIFD